MRFGALLMLTASLVWFAAGWPVTIVIANATFAIGLLVGMKFAKPVLAAVGQPVLEGDPVVIARLEREVLDDEPPRTFSHAKLAAVEVAPPQPVKEWTGTFHVVSDEEEIIATGKAHFRAKRKRGRPVWSAEKLVEVTRDGQPDHAVIIGPSGTVHVLRLEGGPTKVGDKLQALLEFQRPVVPESLLTVTP